MSNQNQLIKKIEDYNFECEAGSLTECAEWIALKKLTQWTDFDPNTEVKEGLYLVFSKRFIGADVAVCYVNVHGQWILDHSNIKDVVQKYKPLNSVMP